MKGDPPSWPRGAHSIAVSGGPQVEPEKLDYHHYLPLFVEGLSETVHPWSFFSRHGTRDLLLRGGARILPVVPQLILPLKSACAAGPPVSLFSFFLSPLPASWRGLTRRAGRQMH